VRTYGWQENDRLSSIQDSQHGLTRFEHDAVGNLAATTFADGTRELRLPDAVGNLFRTPGRTDRRYGPAGQLLEAKGTRYEYDALGNLSKKTSRTGEEWHYSWNSAGHLAEVVRPDGGVVRFTYDALGRRVSKSYKDKVTRWLWDGNQPLHEWVELFVGASIAAAEELVTWLFEEGSFAPLAKISAVQQHSIITDHLGTPLCMFDEDGQQLWVAELDSYGKKVNNQLNMEHCPFRYPGQYEDIETGLYYNRFRYYDPSIGIYISQDPVGILGGTASYGYTSDPTMSVDIFGLSSFALGRNLMRMGQDHAGLVTAANKPTDWQAHHLIPEEVWNSPRNRRLFRDLRLRGRDSATNGIFLPNSRTLGDSYGFERFHSGSHATYSQQVANRMRLIRRNFRNQRVTPSTIAQARQEIQNLQRDLYNELNRRTNGAGCRRLR
jgi:RHS repeat-associated protein